jgi:L-rhamnose isomerase
MTTETSIERAYAHAKEEYARLGVDTETALHLLGSTSVSLNCWQGDDVQGFERSASTATMGGIQVTGGFPGRARTIGELRKDLEKAFSLIPGTHRLNLHAMYGDFGGNTIDRDQILPEHFQSWVHWAKDRDVKLDFNSTCFAHPRADSGFTLSSKEKGVREFWIEHVQRCRVISESIGRSLNGFCIHDLWLPDGSKDATVSRTEHRAILKDSLDRVYSQSLDPRHLKDALEGKLFGIGSEAYVVGSHEFYLSYCVAHGMMLCLDLGHFHPTESVADKVSAILAFTNELLLHVSRGVRWDSDHVVILNDEIRSLMEEIVRGKFLGRVYLALDFFDGSINRIGAWITGARATLKGLLLALLEPTDRLRQFEAEGNLFARLALLEELKSMPFGEVWDYFCLSMNVPPAERWIEEVIQYEKNILRKR